jgi:hypothetical protein
MLTMAHQRNPTGRWWIKADGCDILKGLRESTKREWNGDVDMNDGVPQQHHHKYLSRLTKAATLKCSIPPPDTFYNKSLHKRMTSNRTWLFQSLIMISSLVYIRYITLLHTLQASNIQKRGTLQKWVVGGPSKEDYLNWPGKFMSTRL